MFDFFLVRVDADDLEARIQVWTASTDRATLSRRHCAARARLLI